MNNCKKTPALETGKDLLFGAANQANLTPEQRIQIAHGFLLAAIAEALERILDQIKLELPIHPGPLPFDDPPLDERMKKYIDRGTRIPPEPFATLEQIEKFDE